MRLILFSLLFIPQLLFPQQAKYLPFAYLGNWGMTDSLCNEIITPYYYRIEDIPSEDALLLTNFENGIEYLYFNLKDGSKKKYENYDLSVIKIDNENYSLIQDANKYYLKNEVSNNVIMLSLPLEEMKHLGKDYLIGKYELTKETPLPTGKNKNRQVIPKPIKINNSNQNFIIFKNNKSLDKVFKTETTNYIPLYLSEAETNNNSAEIVVAETKELDLNRNFDFLLFNSDYNYELYSSDFKLIKKFVTKGDELDIAEKCSKIVGKDLSIEPFGRYVNDVSASTPSSGDELVPMPEFESVLENGIYKIVSTDKNKSKVICESNNELVYDIRFPSEIFILNKEKDEYLAKFTFDKNTYKLYLPLKYYALLKLNVPQK
jgi:hypothetical protein